MMNKVHLFNKPIQEGLETMTFFKILHLLVKEKTVCHARFSASAEPIKT